ncbi:class I SAM-dependent methyltransferase [Methanospirillum sp.]|uniref:class I SAM-dependent methyltransferase n=1 Tax=Methanospirillum sp. TaxID=45200 RepID=UPI00359FC627
MKMSKSNLFEKYWSDKCSPMHRSEVPSFFLDKANEHLLYMKPGGILLDYGCGSGDITKFYSPYYEKVIGSDFSHSMLNVAIEKLKVNSINNIEYVYADQKSIWEKIDTPLSGIALSGVVQYFDYESLDLFIKKSFEYLMPGGFLALFDIIHPSIYPLFVAKLMDGCEYKKEKCLKFIVFLRFLMKVLSNKVNNRPPYGDMGYGHYPCQLKKIAESNMVNLKIVNSMYYGYRYHAIFSIKE